jgi:hypothetical protein
MSYENRKYVIFNVSELGSINFDEVMETSADTVRLSLDGTQTFVKFNYSAYTDESGSLVENIPASVDALTTKSQLYSHSEILTLLSGADWTDPNPTEM